MRRSGFGWLVCVMLLLVGCASAPPLPPPVRGSAAADLAAKRFENRPGVARVYVYRNTRHGQEFLMALKLDDVELGTLGSYAFMPLELPAGFHRLSARNEEASSLELNLQAGRSYFVQLNTVLGSMPAKPELLEMHALEGQYAIGNECVLVLPREYRLSE